MKSPKNPSVSVMMILHNDGALVPSIARIFGSDFVMVNVKPLENFTKYTHEVSRVNMTELDTEKNKCSNEVEENSENPGMAMSSEVSEGPKTVEKCILEYYHSNLNCQLPWSKLVFQLRT